MTFKLPKFPPVNWAEVAYIAVAALVCWGALKVHDAHVRKQAYEAFHVDSLNRAVDSLRRDNLARLERAKQSNDSIARLSRKLAAADWQARQATDRADSLAKSLAVQVPDSLRPVVLALDSTYRAALFAKDQMIQIQSAQLRLLGTQLKDANDQIVSYQSQLAAALGQRDAFAREAHPGLLKRIGQALPYVAGAVVLDRLAH